MFASSAATIARCGNAREATHDRERLIGIIGRGESLTLSTRQR
jgi:hypothetical protein